MSISLSDYASIGEGVAVIYLGWRQNRIFERQNEIFAAQGGQVAMPSKTSRLPQLKRYWPTLIMLGLMLLIAYNIYDRHHQEVVAIPEFDDVQNAMMIEGYGADIPRYCFFQTNGIAFASRRSGYKLAIACFIYGGGQDILDAPNLQVSNLYDIHDGSIGMRVDFTDGFNEYRTKMNATGINIAILNVPNGVQTSQFTTLRQARALGVLIPFIGTAQSLSVTPK
jgi:hypothetical protein